jgi:BirA family biotin operon repressor/biotin-[acetyl-CoA-carboxylase] ligase
VVGGVLAESCSLPERSGRAVVIGAGINCLQQRGHFTDELARIATSLECESAEPVNRASVAAGLLARLDHWLRVAVEQPDGWTRVRSAWRVRCQDTGARVTLEHDGRTFTGTALDISEEGDLVVELDQGGRRAFAGTTTARV